MNCGINENAPWFGANDYLISSEPSEHMQTIGKDYLKRNLVNARYLADIGCWNGRHVPILCEIASSKYRVIGIDHPRAIGKRLQQARESHPNVIFRLSELDTLDLEDGEIGGAVCWRVLHNLYQPGKLLTAQKELFRVLAPNAPIVIAVRYPSDDMISEKLIDHESTMPRSIRTFTAVNDREDLYFTEKAFRRVFEFRFEIDEFFHFVEGEIIDGHKLENKYLAVHMRKKPEVTA